MRRRLALLALAVTSLVVIAFTVPLLILVRTQAIERGQIDAEHEAETIAGLVALAVVDELTVAAIEDAVGRVPEDVRLVLPGGQRVGDQSLPSTTVEASARGGVPASGFTSSGDWEVGIPVRTRHGVVAVVATARANELSQGVATAWGVLGGLGILVVAAAVGLAVRLGRELVRPVGELADVAHRLAGGDLSARAKGDGPPELAAVAEALNGLAARLGDMIKEERESLADLSHRLRTPLTSLRLQSERLADPKERALLTEAVDRMQLAVDGMIVEVRHGRRSDPNVDLSEVVNRRIEFWKVLAAEQGRRMAQAVAAGPITVVATADEVGSALDALIGNVMAHTAPGTDFEVRLAEDDGFAVLTIGDAGPGFRAGFDPTRRGVSGAGSTGLGLDIARRLSERSGGSLRIGHSPLGGAQVELRLGLAE